MRPPDPEPLNTCSQVGAGAAMRTTGTAGQGGQAGQQDRLDRRDRTNRIS